MKKIISTVGTSLFTNESKFKASISNDFVTLKEKPASQWDDYKSNIDRIRAKINNNINEKSSAEIKSLNQLMKKFKNENNIELYFLCTDTIVSRLSAEVLIDFFKEKSFNIIFNPDHDVIKDLQVSDDKKFKDGMTKLIDRISSIAGGYFENIVLNITGGFKATIPYMTIMGQINKIPVYYIFEDSDTLIEIPHIPLKVDEDLIGKYLHQLEAVNENPVKESKLDYNFIHECASLLDNIQDGGNCFFLNTLGKMLLSKYKSNYFIFYCPDDIRQEIEGKSEIKNLIRDKYQNIVDGHKVEKKREHYVYDDGNNCNRIFHFKEGEKLYIYKIFTENHKDYESYINTPFGSEQKDRIIKESKIYRIQKEANANV